MPDSEPNRDTWFTRLIEFVLICVVFLGVGAFFDDLGWRYYLTVSAVWLATTLWVLQIVQAWAHRWRDRPGGPREGDPAIETWVAQQARLVLAGRAHRVAATIRRKIKQMGLDPDRRKGADACVNCLLNKSRYLCTTKPSPTGGRSPPASSKEHADT